METILILLANSLLGPVRFQVRVLLYHKGSYTIQYSYSRITSWVTLRHFLDLGVDFKGVWGPVLFNSPESAEKAASQLTTIESIKQHLEIEQCKAQAYKTERSIYLMKSRPYVSKIIIPLLAIIFLSSCTTLSERNEDCIDNMPVEVRDYVRLFIKEGLEHDYKTRLRRLQIKFTDYRRFNNGHYADGWYSHQDHVIYIYKEGKMWNINPKSLLFHELGHAILKRHHQDALNQYNIPISVMYTFSVTDIDLERYWDDYMNELFDKKNR